MGEEAGKKRGRANRKSEQEEWQERGREQAAKKRKWWQIESASASAS